METANAAPSRPKASSGMVYVLTLKPATAKMLTQMSAQAAAIRGSIIGTSLAFEAACLALAAWHFRSRDF